MSKSALYAGLGQGLMSLGQGVGNAIQTMTIEDLRKQNMQENWARQDANKADDRKHQASLTADNRDYAETVTAENQEYQAGLMADQNARVDARHVITDGMDNKKLEAMTSKAKTASTPTETLNVQNMAKAMNISEGEAWKIKTGAKKSNPHQLGLARAKYIQTIISENGDYEYATQVEKDAIVKRSVNMFNQFVGVSPAKKDDEDNNDPLGLR
jgi:hypothetical protein